MPNKTKQRKALIYYEEEIKKLRIEKKKGEEHLTKQTYTAKQFGTASEKVFETLKNPIKMWKSDEYDDKGTILFMYFEEELRYEYNLGFGTTTLAYPIKLINDLEQAKSGSVEMPSYELGSGSMSKKTYYIA